MFLSFAMLYCVLCYFDCNVYAINASARLASDFSTGETFEMGMYPQTKVEDESLIRILNDLQITMFSYDYVRYVTNGNNHVECNMNYGDVVYNGEKYRKVYFSQYRTWHAPNYSYYKAIECQSTNGSQKIIYIGLNGNR